MKKFIKVVLPVSIIVVVIGIFICIYFYDIIFDRSIQIDVSYLCEIPVSSDMKNIYIIKNQSPRLSWIGVSEYESLLGEVLEKSDLSDEEINNIKNSIENLPDDKYIYVSVGRKLERVYYSEQPADYGYNGVYGTQQYEAVFIYWADEPLGNIIDGWV